MTVKIRPSYLRLVRAERDPLDLRPAVTPRPPRVTPLLVGDVLAAVVRRTGIDAQRMASRAGCRDATYARHLAWYLLRQAYRLAPLSELCLLFDRDHSTVLAGIHRIELEITTRPQTAADVMDIRRKLAAKVRRQVEAEGAR